MYLRQLYEQIKYIRRNEDDEPMNDGSHIVFIINEEHSRKRSEEKELLHDHKCTEPEDMILFSRLKAPVRTESAGE